MKTKIAKLISTLSISFFLIGCGSGGSSGGGSDTVQTGIFIDAPVQGLKYETATQSGYTDESGTFKYKTGESVTFKLGNLELGSVAGSSTITPLTLTGESDLNNIGTKATNIARILQTLDNSSSNGAILRVPTSLQDLNISGLNLESDADLGTILTKAQEKTAISYNLKDANSAKNEMKKYINAYQMYPKLNEMYYSNTGKHSYLLTMTQRSNIIFKQSGNRSYIIGLALGQAIGTYNVKIYDLDFNQISLSDSLSGTLDVGTYIIEVTYSSSSISTLTVYSPNFEKKPEQIKNNITYNGEGDKFYSLHLPSDGYIYPNYTITGLGGSGLYLYDENLNFIQTLEGKVNLTSGNYIILMSHSGFDQTKRTFSITSDVLN